MSSEYKRCECDTRLSTNPESMSVEFGGDPTQCVYKSKDQHTPGDTDPYRIMENDKMYCEVLEGSCFTVKYYRQKADGRDADCVSRGKFGSGWEAVDGRILGGWAAQPPTDNCTIEAFSFTGCAVNETRKLIEYQRTQKKTDEEINLDDLEDQGMCQGEPKSNYGMKQLYGLDSIHHIRLAEKMFSRTYCCNETMCNAKDYPYHGKTMVEWMVLMEDRIINLTAIELELKKKLSSTSNLLVFLPLL